jgi:hypothetical protein
MTFRALLRDRLRRIGKSLTGLDALEERLAEEKILTAKVLINQMKAKGIQGTIRESEFKAFSQFGDDGIIQYLIHHIGIPVEQRIFIEFGVESYEEANTRFLLMNDNWRGLIMDGSAVNIKHVQRASLYWKHDLTAVAAFITRDNVNSLFREHGITGEIGLLSIDIDGNDYWVWERIEVINPTIVIIEYNSIFGWQHAVTIPYDPAFRRTQAHYSNLYWGCSLQALCLLGEQKGYAFIGCNDAGNNAYFVRKDRLGPLKVISAEEGYVESHFRESRSPLGELSYLSGNDRLHEIRNMDVYDVEQKQISKIVDVFKQ